MMTQPVKRREQLTFKGNLKHTRYGWLRLTPAYSPELVSQILDRHDLRTSIILDPFCGTGTTALACAERGIPCDTTDINPFLLWLGKSKTQHYSSDHMHELRETATQCVEWVKRQYVDGEDAWIPPLYRIEKWWEHNTLRTLALLMKAIHTRERTITEEVVDLLKVVFCRVMIETSNASFGHQSMSFKKDTPADTFDKPIQYAERVIERWWEAIADIERASASSIQCTPKFLLKDARHIGLELEHDYYTHVITSPPYPNRVSYIRELRPYMYWLGYLTESRAAGEMDWQAIGGTWGIATSRVGKWEPGYEVEIPFREFRSILSQIAEHSTLLSQYVHKYFYDIVLHCRDIYLVTRSRALLTYIVGNSKFYHVVLPVEQIYADILRNVGFTDITVQKLRKRSSKKELFEYIVSARKP